MMNRQWLACCIGAAAPMLAMAGPFDGTVSNLPVGFSFGEYTNATLADAGPAVGGGFIDINSKLFYIDERSGPGGKAWYFFFDPAVQQTLGTSNKPVVIKFNQKITNVWSSSTEMNDLGRNSTYGVDLNGDLSLGTTLPSTVGNRRNADYLTSANIGRETGDFVTRVVGDDYTLQIRFSASDPGDHFRVTVVPEPEAYGLALAGIGVMAFALRGRRRATA